MPKYCSCCGEKTRSKKRFCCDICSDIYQNSEREKREVYEILGILADSKVINSLKGFIESTFQDQRVMKKKLFLAQQGLIEQNNLWENFLRDVTDETISPAFIRWWSKKLVEKHNLDSENRMIGWLLNVAEVLDVYSNAKN